MKIPFRIPVFCLIFLLALDAYPKLYWIDTIDSFADAEGLEIVKGTEATYRTLNPFTWFGYVGHVWLAERKYKGIDAAPLGLETLRIVRLCPFSEEMDIPGSDFWFVFSKDRMKSRIFPVNAPPGEPDPKFSYLLSKGDALFVKGEQATHHKAVLSYIRSVKGLPEGLHPR